jgi:hypothetical protein
MDMPQCHVLCTLPVYLGFVVLCIFNIQIKTPNKTQQLIIKFIALSHRRRSTCFRHYYAHHQESFQTAVAATGFRMNAEVDVFPAVVGWKHVHLGMAETCS